MKKINIWEEIAALIGMVAMIAALIGLFVVLGALV